MSTNCFMSALDLEVDRPEILNKALTGWGGETLKNKLFARTKKALDQSEGGE